MTQVKGTATPLTPPQAITPQDLAQWGAGICAYARPVEVDDKTVFAIYGADGQQLGLASDPEAARAAIREYDLEPVSVN